MADWAQWLEAQRAAGRSAWAFFNNDIDGHAIRDALALRLALEQIGETAHHRGGVG